MTRITFAAAAVAASLGLAACSSVPMVGDLVSSAPESTLPAGVVTAMGDFTGDSGHVVKGKAYVSRIDGVWTVTLDENFSLDNGPDPKVALGNNGYVKGTILGKLENLEGRQSYALPDSLDIGDYTQVYIWCEEFSVPLGHADLTLL